MAAVGGRVQACTYSYCLLPHHLLTLSQSSPWNAPTDGDVFLHRFSLSPLYTSPAVQCNISQERDLDIGIDLQAADAASAIEESCTKMRASVFSEALHRRNNVAEVLYKKQTD